MPAQVKLQILTIIFCNYLGFSFSLKLSFKRMERAYHCRRRKDTAFLYPQIKFYKTKIGGTFG